MIKGCIRQLFRFFWFIIGRILLISKSSIFNNNQFIIYVDGGICSQMHQYMIGQWFKSKGYIVRYDLSIYKSISSSRNRTFSLRLAYPNIIIDEAGIIARNVFKSLYFFQGRYPNDYSTIWTELEPLKYLGGYYADPVGFYSNFKEFFPIDIEVLDERNLEIFNSIGEKSVAVHIRRGDLSTYTDAYGFPSDISYFENAINQCQLKENDFTYYFFSDDMNYVENNLLEKLSSLSSEKIIMIRNSQEKGYYDLLLMSKCKNHICSKGTLGKYGSLLSQNGGFVIMDKTDKQDWYFEGLNKEVIKI